MSVPLVLSPLLGLPEVVAGDDLAALLAPRLAGADEPVVLVVSSKVVSKALGLTAPASSRAAVVDAETVRVVARLPLPAFADLVLVGVFVSEAEVDYVAVRAASRAHAELAGALEREGPRPRCSLAREPSFGASPARLVPKVDDAALAVLAANEEQLALLRSMDLRSYVVAPLVARGRAFGMLVFCSSTRSYDDIDLAMAEAFGVRAALAIDNAARKIEKLAAD